MDAHHIPTHPVSDCKVMFQLHTSLSMHLLQLRPGRDWQVIKDHRSESNIGCEQHPSMVEPRPPSLSSWTVEMDSQLWSHRPTHSLVTSTFHSPQCSSPVVSSPELDGSQTETTDPSSFATTPETFTATLIPSPAVKSTDVDQAF